ncbi:hypothetical protein HGK34_12240 [Myceligenerans sp. I2]|uniref:LppX_LprAFG lipoprotein n=1 Tax=Myceligenerans indicum TaxID=2593663 RepID=A0ABS1LLA1_9MICO|nr:hypothetical protein [Myceligenerans indicum]
MIALTLMIAACTASFGDGGPGPNAPRPVTVAESRLLADVRLRNLDAGSRAISATYTDQDREMRLSGWFDFRTRTGYGMVSADGLPSDRVAWNDELVATSAAGSMGKPLTSLDGWVAAPLDPGRSPLAVVLAVVAGLGAERPDDAALIRAGGALRLREDEAGGEPVTVFTGPAPVGAGAADRTPAAPDTSPLRYWVDEDGLAHRVDVRLGEDWAEVTLENDDVPVPPLLAELDLDAGGERAG